MRTPRPWQTPMITHIQAHKRCAVYAGVGTGKTGAVYVALDELSAVDAVYPALVLSTLRVARDTWMEEIAKWEHLRHIRVVAVVGTVAERIAALRKPAEYYCTNYENLPWLVEYLGNKWPFKTIVGDESSKLRGFRLRQGTMRSRALAKRAHTHSNRFIELTGTPSPNGLKNLWGQLWFIDQGLRLGRSYDSFRHRWFQLSFDGYGMDPLPHAQVEIQDKIKDVCLSVDLSDYVDVAKPIVNNIMLNMPKAAMVVYKEMEKHAFVEIKENCVEAFNAASRTNKCLQIANGALYVGGDNKNWEELHTVKLDALDDIVEDCVGFPILVAYNFVSDQKRILARFPFAVDLSTTKGMTAFKKGKSAMGIGHPASIGHGIDGLQDVTNIMVNFGHNWDLELYDQFVGRIGPVRQMQSGHNRPVFIHNLVMRDTMDECVIERRDSKRSVQDILLEAVKRRESE